MKKTSRILGVIGIGAILGISCTFAYTAEENEAYEWAYLYGITTQPTIEAANLDGKLTRQELAKMLTNYIENTTYTQPTSSTCSFTDEDQINENLKPYTKKICAYQIMGSNGTAFRPTSKVTRAELGTTISRMLWGDRYNVEGKDYYIYHVNALKDYGIMNNIENPTKTFARRGDTLIMLKRLYDKEYNQTYTYTYSDEDYYTYTDEDDYISDLYSNSNVIYTAKDGTKYYYDADFLKVLKNLANKNGESDLKKYLEIEYEYFQDGLTQIAGLELDEDQISEMLGIDLTDLDVDNMSNKEKQQLLKKIKNAIDGLLKDNETRNEKYINNLENVVKKIGDDKFELKDKYQETKTFVEETNSFLREYLEKLYKILNLSLTEEELDDEEGFALVFGLMGDIMSYKVSAANYQEYIEEWATNTIDILLGELDTNNTNNQGNNSINNTNNSSGSIVCTLESYGTDTYKYKIDYDGEYVNLLNAVNIIHFDDEQRIQEYKNTLEEIYETNKKNLKYYDYKIKTSEDTLISKVTINYEKIDMDELIEIDPGVEDLLKNNKISLEKFVEYYEMIGATCE